MYGPYPVAAKSFFWSYIYVFFAKHFSEFSDWNHLSVLFKELQVDSRYLHINSSTKLTRTTTIKVYMDLWLKYLQIRLTINIVKITDRRSIFNSCEYVELKWSKGRFLKPSSWNFPISPLISKKFERIPTIFYWICKFLGIIILHQS